MAYAPGISYDTHSLAQGLSTGLGRLFGVWQQKVEEDKRMGQNAKIADSLVKTNPEMLGKLGMTPESFALLPAKDRIAMTAGAMQGHQLWNHDRTTEAALKLHGLQAEEAQTKIDAGREELETHRNAPKFMKRVAELMGDQGGLMSQFANTTAGEPEGNGQLTPGVLAQAAGETDYAPGFAHATQLAASLARKVRGSEVDPALSVPQSVDVGGKKVIYSPRTGQFQLEKDIKLPALTPGQKVQARRRLTALETMATDPVQSRINPNAIKAAQKEMQYLKQQLGEDEPPADEEDDGGFGGALLKGNTSASDPLGLGNYRGK